MVVAVGACGISGGIFGTNHAPLAESMHHPVDVYIPGCPPRPQALLHGILLAVGRLAEKGAVGETGIDPDNVHRKAAWGRYLPFGLNSPPPGSAAVSANGNGAFAEKSVTLSLTAA